MAADSKPAATLALLQDWWTAWQQADHDPAHDLIPFQLQDKDGTLDPVVCTATRPKMAVLLRVMAAMGIAETNPMQAAVQMENLLDRIVDADSAAHLRGRMLDSDDYLGFEFTLGVLLESKPINVAFPVVFDRQGVPVPVPQSLFARQ